MDILYMSRGCHRGKALICQWYTVITLTSIFKWPLYHQAYIAILFAKSVPTAAAQSYRRQKISLDETLKKKKFSTPSICEDVLKRIVRDFFNDFQLSTWKTMSRWTWDSLDSFRELKRMRQTASTWLTQRLGGHVVRMSEMFQFRAFYLVSPSR